ncbi:14259_t:CDS:2, partial [Acaulospora morrowiae]
MDEPIYTFVNGVPTDPQVLVIYNGLSRVQRARYNTLDGQGKSGYLHAVAEEKKKPRHYLNLVYAVINLLSIIGLMSGATLLNAGIITSLNKMLSFTDYVFSLRPKLVGGSGRPNLDVAKYRDFFCRSWDIVCG